MNNDQVKQRPAFIAQQIRELELHYNDELRKGAPFSVKKSIREKLRDLKESLDQLAKSNHIFK